jgi:hypothetical protein
MESFFWVLLPFLFVFVIVFSQAARPVTCPDCGDPMPLFYSPFQKTRRMWRAGGYLCSRCGCETDMAGRKITADTPPAPFPTRSVSVLVVALVVAIGLIAVVLSPPLPKVTIPEIKPVVVEPPEQKAFLPFK